MKYKQRNINNEEARNFPGFLFYVNFFVRILEA